MSTKLVTSGVTKYIAKSADVRSYGDAQALVGWLNEEPKQRDRRRTAQLITALRDLNATGDVKARDLFFREIQRIIAPLRRLPWTIALRFVPRQLWCLEQTRPDNSGIGLLLVARLSSHGLDWVRQCPGCAEWFIAKKKNNFFNSDACRMKVWGQKRKSPEEKRDRAKYMRNLRARKKEMQRGKKALQT